MLLPSLREQWCCYYRKHCMHRHSLHWTHFLFKVTCCEVKGSQSADLQVAAASWTRKHPSHFWNTLETEQNHSNWAVDLGIFFFPPLIWCTMRTQRSGFSQKQTAGEKIREKETQWWEFPLMPPTCIAGSVSHCLEPDTLPSHWVAFTSGVFTVFTLQAAERKTHWNTCSCCLLWRNLTLVQYWISNRCYFQLQYILSSVDLKIFQQKSCDWTNTSHTWSI